MTMRIVGLVAIGLVVSACSAATATSPTGSVSAPSDTVIAEAVAALPADLVSEGVLVVGTNPGLEPFTYRAQDEQITGADIDLMRALAERLGLSIRLEDAGLDAVIAGVASGAFDVGAAGIFDTPERRASVDFIGYLRGGTQWAVLTGSDVTPARACGLRVLAITGSVQADVDIPERSVECVSRGEAPLRATDIDSSSEAGVRIIRDEADAFVADAPVVAHLVGMSKGRLAIAGAAYDPQMYGLAVGRDAAGLRTALEIALESMIEDGTYGRIMGKWGIQDGALGLG